MPEETIDAMKKELGLLGVEDVMKITGWGEVAVRNLMEEDDFPALKIGKSNQVLFGALQEYLKQRRIKRGM